MQIITNISKFLVLTVLTFSLLTNWYASEVEPFHFNFTDYSAENRSSTDASLWDTMRNEFTIDNRAQSAQVQAEIHKLLADPGRLSHILKNAIPYIYFIHEQTTAHGLPAELALIPVIESEFNPNDKSTKGATGLWQLMTTTAHDLGIKVRSGYDGRRNVVASTKAALAYFRDLGKYFNGNWYLAIAAYNCGDGRVKSAIRKAGSNSFWDLPLPKETKYYVPRLLAVAEIIKNPAKYGVELPQVSNSPYFEEVKVNKPVNLQKIANATGVSMETLSKLNPDFTHGSKPNKEMISLLVPTSKATIAKATITA